MLDLGPEKLLVLGLIALIVLGPHRLPDAARSLGRIIGQLRAMSHSFQTEVRDALGEPAEAFTSAMNEFRPPDIRRVNVGRTVRQAVVSTLTPASPVDQAVARGEANGSIPPSGPPTAVVPDDPSLN